MTSISIIIPVYNVEKYVESCIKSVIAQTYHGLIECIIVDDCGSDRSMEIVRQITDIYSGPIKFRIIHHELNQGLSAARNTGIKSATGDYLYFLDSDDKLTPKALELLSYPLKDKIYDLVIGNYEIVGVPNNIPALKIADNTELVGCNVLESYAQNLWYMMAWNKLCNRTFIIDNNLFFEEGLIHEDDLWSFQVAVLAKTMFVVDKPCYLYRIREGSITAPKQIARNLSFRMIVDTKIASIISEKRLYKIESVHHYVNKLIVSHLKLIKSENCNQILKEYYISLRTSHKEPIRDILRINGLNLKAQLRDFHLILPVSIGLTYVTFAIFILRVIRNINK